MCQPTGPTASVRAGFYCFLHGNGFSQVLILLLTHFPVEWALLFPPRNYISPELKSWVSGKPHRGPSKNFLSGNEITKSTLFLGQIINMNSLKVLPKDIKHFATTSPRECCWDKWHLGPDPTLPWTFWGLWLRAQPCPLIIGKITAWVTWCQRSLLALKFLWLITSYPKDYNLSGIFI